MSENKTGNYFKYAIGEIILVVIGILIALQINNWNEKRLENQFELKTLTELKSALKQDLKDIKFNAKRHMTARKSCDMLVAYMQADRPYHDSLAKHFSRVNYITTFLPQLGPYETIKTKGLTIINNDSIRKQIANYYETDIVFAQSYEKYNLESISLIRELYFKNFKSARLFSTSVPNDFEALKKNSAFITFLINTSSFRLNESRVYSGRLGPNCEALIANIEVELKARE